MVPTRHNSPDLRREGSGHPACTLDTSTVKEKTETLHGKQTEGVINRSLGRREWVNLRSTGREDGTRGLPLETWEGTQGLLLVVEDGTQVPTIGTVGRDTGSSSWYRRTLLLVAEDGT